jgi:UDPglucose 6-dehydrogenase
VSLAVVGAGYVGLVTAACLAHLGNEVRVLDIDLERVTRLRLGETPIREPGLDEMVVAGLASSRLSFDTDPRSIHGSRLAIVAVGTLDDAGEWTDRHVRDAVLAIAADPLAPRAIVIRSTLMPGTAVTLAAEARALAADIAIALNPEFTREASAVSDFLAPDRIVFGVEDTHRTDDPLREELRRLYAPLEAPVHVTDLTSAEMVKVASNVFLAAKITFANELARLCATLGADVGSVVDGMGLDRRIGRSFLSPGPGFGGSCFPSQARALPRLARERHVATPLISAVAPSNTYQADWVVEGLERARGGSLRDVRVAVLGLAFKAGTADLRESPAMTVVKRLAERGASVAVYDPMAGSDAIAELAAEGFKAEGAVSAEDASRDADALIVATEWPEFRSLDWVSIADRMRGRHVIDARRVVDLAAAAAAGLEPMVLGVPARAVALTR